MATATKRTRKVAVRVPTLSTVRRPRSDFDVDNLTLTGGPLTAKIKAAVTDGSVETTLDGASTLTLTVNDWGRRLLQSALLAGNITLAFDGISYTLVKLSAADVGALTLTFEETAVNLLRQYNKPKTANRNNVTRAQFVQSMVTEVREAKIPFSCPEVNKRQPISGDKGP